jgi:asparagine synthetase B (glutamine-hydrolysing)
MFVAAIGDTDEAVHHVIDEVSEYLPQASVSRSVCEGIAIARWHGPGLERSVFAGDHAYVGTLRGEFPAPGTELRGDFALAARSGGRLRLARGRFAGRPLYWMRIGPITVACSRMLPLAILSGGRARLNVEHVLGIFDTKFWMLEAPLPFVGAKRVHPNGIIDLSAAGQIRTHVGALPLEDELRLSPRDLAGALRHELEGAVARECAGARRVAVLTGGGVDSSNLLAIAVHHARRHGTADAIPLALDYGGDGDDRPHLIEVCRHLGIEALRVAPVEGVPYAGRERVVDGAVHGTAPSSSLFAAVERAKATGVELLLAGDGAEWTLDASSAVFGDFLLRSPLNALWCASRFRSICETRPQIWRRLVVGPFLRGALPAFFLHRRRLRVERRTGLGRSRTLAWAGPRLKAFLTASRNYPPQSPIQSQRERVLALASASVPMVIRESFSRWEIACGLPIAFPYLDDEFARFAARVPSGAIFAGARERGLLRESMEGLIPDRVRYRMDKARPHRAFAELFSASGGLDAVKDLVTMRELECLGIVEAKGFRAAFERFAADPYADAAAWTTLWPAITAEAYVRWFNDFKTRTPHTRSSATAPS